MSRRERGVRVGWCGGVRANDHSPLRTARTRSTGLCEMSGCELDDLDERVFVRMMIRAFGLRGCGDQA
ncbi:MAG: hypothetical protein FWD57_09665 [Polyangiaceae bacterium]|nr:hypothetical protein [Polyangiaceae bacterium]